MRVFVEWVVSTEPDSLFDQLADTFLQTSVVKHSIIVKHNEILANSFGFKIKVISFLKSSHWCKMKNKNQISNKNFSNRCILVLFHHPKQQQQLFPTSKKKIKLFHKDKVMKEICLTATNLPFRRKIKIWIESWFLLQIF